MSMMQVIPFQGDALLAQQQDDGEVLVALRPICAALGLDWHAQRQRIHRDAILSQGAVMITSPTAGGLQEVMCLPLKYLNGWLFGIDERRVKESVRDKVLAYKRECYEVLWQHFKPVASLEGSGVKTHTFATPVADAVSERTMRENEWWLSLVREARLLKGRAAAVALWARSPLPPLPEEPLLEISHQVDLFLAERTERGTQADRVEAATLYAAYAEWCEDAGQEPVSMNAFGRHLSGLGLHRVRVGTRTYCGIKLRNRQAE